jgi:NADH-quinone oxidoreductase subunit L
MLVSDTDGAAESGSGQDALETAGASGGHEDERTEYTLMAIAIAIALGGIVTARAFYRKPSGIPARIAAAAGPVYRLVYNKYWVDELYDAAVLRPYYKTCEILQAFDRWVLDGLVNAAGGFTELIGQVLRLFQTGFVRHYALLVFLGAVALVWFLER